MEKNRTQNAAMALVDEQSNAKISHNIMQTFWTPQPFYKSFNNVIKKKNWMLFVQLVVQNKLSVLSAIP